MTHTEKIGAQVQRYYDSLHDLPPETRATITIHYAQTLHGCHLDGVHLDAEPPAADQASAPTRDVEQAAAERDANLFGYGYLVNGQHIPTPQVTLLTYDRETRRHTTIRVPTCFWGHPSEMREKDHGNHEQDLRESYA